MNESKYKKYYYDTNNIQDNTIHSINRKELDYILVNEEQFSNMRNGVTKPTTRLRNNYATR